MLYRTALACAALLLGCEAPREAPTPVGSQAIATTGVAPGEGEAGVVPLRAQAAICTSNPVVLEAMALWSQALAPYAYNGVKMPALRASCGIDSVPVWEDSGLYSRTKYYGWFAVPTSIAKNGALIVDPTYLTVPIAMHEIGHALGLGHLEAGVMRTHDISDVACIDAATAARFPGAVATCDD